MDMSNIRSGRITAIKDSARDAERVAIHIDGAFAFAIARLIVLGRSLEVGLELSEADVAALLAADEVDRATQSALRFLSYRPRSTREVTDRLRQHGFSNDAIDSVISKLQDWRYLDDSEFARLWVENRSEHRPAGERLLRQELLRKGVDRDLVARTIDEAELNELPAAIDLARKRAERLRGLDLLTRRRRLAAYLQRRGYDWDVVKSAIDQVLGEDEDAESE